VVVYAAAMLWVFLLYKARIDASNSFSIFKGSGLPAEYRFLDLWSAAQEYALCENISSVTLVLAYLKIIKFMQYIPKVGPDMLSLLKTLVNFSFSITV